VAIDQFIGHGDVKGLALISVALIVVNILMWQAQYWQVWTMSWAGQFPGARLRPGRDTGWVLDACHDLRRSPHPAAYGPLRANLRTDARPATISGAERTLSLWL
jgi:hypothetical protein